MSTVFIGQILSEYKDKAKPKDDTAALNWIDLEDIDNKILDLIPQCF
jgi:hypothetical protein